MTKTTWTPTRHGGFRRQAGVAQQLGNPREAKDEARAVATADGEAGVDAVSTQEERHSDEVEGGGSNPSPGTDWIATGTREERLKRFMSLNPRKTRAPRKFIFAMNERLGLPSCPYVIRWRLETPWGSIRLHHWLAPDDDRAKHDHPWNFVTFVLKGGYTDSSPDGDEHLRAPAVRYRDATHQHTVVPDQGGAWTVIITGPKIRPWGFWVNGKFRSRVKYFWKFGHHPCD